MDLLTKIIGIYDELSVQDFYPGTGSILLSDDGDGVQYISKWDYSKPLPEGLKLGK